MEPKCPKCGINVIDVSFESVKERHLAVLLAEKHKREMDGAYLELKCDGNGFAVEDCDLCGAIADDIRKQAKIDLGKV